ncbi:MAG: DeoR/GlpR family DNA-binding transcription regulator [Victivallaceae bacterium]|nr:DeoR/GlpR family DNA-binding transcription regulator [Victivallaceae bacterium]
MNRERRKEILAFLEQNAFLATSSAAKHWRTSESSIRRDFAFFAENGLVRRVQGGVRRLEKAENTSIPLPVRNEFFAEEKRRIAERAAQMLPPEGAVFLHGGSTTQLMTSYLEHGCIVTDSVGICDQLGRKYAGGGGPEVILSGGIFDLKAGVLCGSRAEAMLSQYRADIAFFSTRGLDEEGLLDTNDQVAAILRVMIRRCAKAVLLADHSKFTAFGVARVVAWHEIDTVITRRTEENSEFLDALARRKIEILTV